MDKFNYSIYLLTSATVFFTFVIFILYVRNNFNKGGIFLGIAFLLFCLGLRFFSIHLYLNELIQEFPHFLLINNLTSRVAMPVLYFVVLSSLYSWKLKWFDGLHAILPVLFVLHFSEIFFAPAAIKVALIQEMNQLGYESVWQKGVFKSRYLVNAIKYLTLYGYVFLILSLLLWSKNYKRLPNHLSLFFKLALVFLFINLIPSLISHFGLDIWEYASAVGATSTLLFILGIFMVPDFLFPKVNSNLDAVLDFGSVTSRTLETFADKATEDVNSKLFSQITTYFEEEKPFLNQDFSLRSLEKYFGISGRYISESIKMHTGLNFSTYVNQARLNYLADTIGVNHSESTKNKPLEVLAQELGFQSFSSFYQFIKKQKGCTPKEFLISLEKDKRST